MLELTDKQRATIVVMECEYQLTTMKQYLSEEHTAMYTALLNRYATLLEYERIMLRHEKAFK